MEILFNTEQEPYESLIKQHINTNFRKNVSMDKCELLELISNIIIGTKEIRYGSLPTPESLVKIREVVRISICDNKPIPILIPWGSIKGNLSGTLDIAELMAIKNLIFLQKEIVEIYPKGLDIVIRIEDFSGDFLFKDNAAIYRNNSVLYTESIKSLINILDANTFITLVLESEMGEEKLKNCNLFMQRVLPAMINYLNDSEDVEDTEKENIPSYQELQSHGWKGIIPSAQRNHYYNLYSKIYEGNGDPEIIRLAIYLTSALTRSKSNMRGNKEEWGQNYIQLTFVPPVKGLPHDYDLGWVYYRTLPLSQARTHISPWRSRGYYQISGNEIIAKISSFREPLDLIKSEITLTNNSEKVIIDISYVLR